MWLLGRYLLKLEADFFEEVTLHRFDCICNWGKNERKKTSHAGHLWHPDSPGMKVPHDCGNHLYAAAVRLLFPDALPGSLVVKFCLRL